MGWGGTTLAQAQTWLNGHGVTYPVTNEDSPWPIATLYGVSGTPIVFIIGRDMVIRKVIGGAVGCDIMEGYLRDVIYMRDPINLEMVMDVSDSMNSPSPSDPGGDTKLTMMKQVTTIITDFMHDHGQGNDRMGLVWFTDNASEYTGPAGDKLLLIQSDLATLKGEISAHGTGICTAMGAGLQTAFNTLVTKPSHRFAILCTDGMQNIEPKVTKVSSHYEIIDSGGWLCGSHSSNLPNPGVDLASYNTRVHTIGVGIEASYAPLLQNLADSMSGFYKGTDDPENDLDLIYFTDLCNCMAGGSPGVVLHSPAKLNAEQCIAEEYFSLNRTVRKITVMLSWKKSLGGSLAFWLFAPDGRLLNIHQEIQYAETYAKATIYLPKLQDGNAVEYVGRWRMVIGGQFTGTFADYHALVIAEDQKVKFHVDYPRKIYLVGEILPIQILVEAAEKPILRVSEIVIETAQLPVPLPELIAQYRASSFEIRQRVKCAEPSTDPVLMKLRAMSSDPLFQNRVKPVRRLVSLSEGSIKPEIGEREIIVPFELKQAGLQTFKVMIKTEIPQDGPIHRVDMLSVLVQPGPTDLKNTTIVPIERSIGNMKGVLLLVTPRNSRGQLVGPGHASEFKAMVENKVTKVEVEDLLDGSYQIEMLLPKKEWTRLKKVDKALNLKFQKLRIWE